MPEFPMADTFSGHLPPQSHADGSPAVFVRIPEAKKETHTPYRAMWVPGSRQSHPSLPSSGQESSGYI